MFCVQRRDIHSCENDIGRKWTVLIHSFYLTTKVYVILHIRAQFWDIRFDDNDQERERDLLSDSSITTNDWARCRDCKKRLADLRQGVKSPRLGLRARFISLSIRPTWHALSKALTTSLLKVLVRSLLSFL